MFQCEKCVTETRQHVEHQALLEIHLFSKAFMQSIMGFFFGEKPELPPKPTNADEMEEWWGKKMLADEHDLQKGFHFGTPPRETSFHDSFECALFLAENGHYTQAMMLLRTALNNVLATAMKQIVQTLPERVQKSEYLREMFGKEIENLDKTSK